MTARGPLAEMTVVDNASEPTLQDLAGSCHCGNVSFVVAWPLVERVIAVRACGCSFCRKHGGVWTSHPQARLRVGIGDPAKLEPYRFGTGTAEFHVCLGCGVVPFVTSTIAAVRYGIVNANCFDDLQDIALSEKPVHFDGETAERRLDRRSQTWIAEVAVTSTR